MMTHSVPTMGFLKVVIGMALLLFPQTLRAQWAQTSLDSVDASSLLVVDSLIFVGSDKGVFTSADSGKTWIAANQGLPTGLGRQVNALAQSDTTIYAGTFGGVFKSIDRGSTWTASNVGLGNLFVRSLAISDSILLAGTDGGVFRSSNHAESWKSTNSGLSNTFVNNVYSKESTFFAGTDGGLFRSPASDTTWANITNEIANSSIFAIGSLGERILVGTNGGGVFESTNQGNNWSQIATVPINSYVRSILTHLGVLYVGMLGDGVYRSIDSGSIWTDISQGLPSPSPSVRALSVFGSNLVATVVDSGVWLSPLSQTSTLVYETNLSAPIRFQLQQNYPNPFNSQTTIRFQVNIRTFLQIDLFDAIGRPISRLVSETLESGSYSRVWDAANLPSGVYFYRVLAGGSGMTKRAILLK